MATIGPSGYPPPPPSWVPSSPPGHEPPPGPPGRPPIPGMRSALIALIASVTVAVLVAGALGIVLVVRNSDDGGSGGSSDSSSVITEASTSDDQVKAGVEAIARGAEEFAGAYGYGPGMDDALPTGALAEFVDPWPTNPYTGEPMTQSSAPGDYSFATAISMGDGQEYLGYVTANLSTGETYSVEFTY